MSRAILLSFLPLVAVLAAGSPKAVLPEAHHDFGVVKRGEKVVHRFHIRNEGSAPLNLERAELNAPGMSVRYRKVIPPAEEGIVTVEWNTERVKGKQEAEILVHCDDPSQPELRMLLKGTVQPPIEFQPYAAVFLSLFQDESGERSVRIFNHQDRPLHIAKVHPSAAYVTPVLRTLREGQDYELAVKVGPSAPVGRHQEAVSLQTDDPASPQLRVIVNVLVKTEVYANPELIDFGAISLEQLRVNPSLADLLSMTFLVKKRTGTFAIRSVTSDLPALTIRREPEGPSEVFRVDVKLAPAMLRPGELKGAVRVKTSDPRYPELLLPVVAQIH